MSSKFVTQTVVAATDIDLALGFQPKSVVVRNITNGNKLEWVEGMQPGTSLLTAAASGIVSIAFPTYVWARTTVDLTFTALATGDNYFRVAVIDAGAGATVPALDVTGTGTEADPFVYTFTIYDDTNANEDFIDLLAADDYLRATGASSADETVADSLNSTALVGLLGVTVRGLSDIDEQSLGLGVVIGQAVGINASADAGDVLSIEASRGDQLL